MTYTKTQEEKNPAKGEFITAAILYSGKSSFPKIKLDLTADELLVLPPSKQPVIHTYSNLPDDGIFASCYSYPEVFGEKVRALGERGRPRDLYDVINLYRNDQLPDSAVIQAIDSIQNLFPLE